MNNNFVCFWDSISDRNTWININQVQTVYISDCVAGYSVEVTLNGGVSSQDATAATVSRICNSYVEAEEAIKKLLSGVNYWEELLTNGMNDV